MDFARLVAPAGEWEKIWLAALWEKRLGRRDYEEIDLRRVLASFLARRAILSLRATGHLLVGGVKVFAKKCLLLEEEVQEVCEKLRRVGERPGRLSSQRTSLLREVDAEALRGEASLEALLSGRRHVARLEDITLTAPARSRAQEGEELFGAATGEELKAAVLDFAAASLLAPDMALPNFDALPNCDALPSFPAASLLTSPEPPATPLPPSPAQPLEEPLPAWEPELPPPIVGEEEEENEGLEERGLRDRDAKRRRKGQCAIDEATEIPPARYQRYALDRRAITRRPVLDFAVVLPHYGPELPDFLTTYTELCPALNDLLIWGTEVAERKRRRSQEEEMGPAAAWPWRPQAAGASLAPEPPPEPAEEAPAAPAPLEDAPRTLSAVVLEDGGAQARRGYSCRTEQMHRFLERAFGEAQEQSLSYTELCEGASGRREVVGGSFFELLVLRSSGVIKLEQESPRADIRISWSG